MDLGGDLDGVLGNGLGNTVGKGGEKREDPQLGSPQVFRVGGWRARPCCAHTAPGLCASI